MADPVISPIIKRSYGERLTLDLDTSLPATQPGGCLSLKNVLRKNGKNLAKRPGVRMVASDECRDFTSEVALSDTTPLWIGLHYYEFQDTDNETNIVPLVIGGGKQNLFFTLGEGTIAVNYSGVGTASVEILSTGSAWQVTLYVNNVAVSGWPKTYSDGLGTTGRIDTLVTDIDNEANWTATDASTHKDKSMVAQIGSLAKTDLVSASTPDLAIHYQYPSTISAEGASFEPGGFGPCSPYYQNLKGVNAQNCVFFPAGLEHWFGHFVMKYDGFASYRPGMPRALLSSIADAGSGSTHAAGNTYLYRVAFWRVDNRGNIIRGPYSDDTLAVASHTVGGTPRDINVVFCNLNNSNYSYGADFRGVSCTVNGNQSGASTITVDSGHNVEIGDVLYLLNRATGAYVTKTITGTTSTSVTFSGNINCNDNDVFGNIRVQIQRSFNQGIDFFEVANIPNNANNSVTTQTYVDAIADASLGSAIEEQRKLPEPPPAASFCCMHQGLIVYARLLDFESGTGIQIDENGFTWNDPTWGLEAYPKNTNRDQVIGGGPGGITGIASESDNILAIFKERAYFRIEGDLAAGQYTITEVGTTNLGVSSHASLVKFSEGMIGISREGPVLIQNGEISLAIGNGVLDFFEEISYEDPPTYGDTIIDADEGKLVPMRATGAYWPRQKCIVFFIPAEEGTLELTSTSNPGMTRFANASSLWLCYDIRKKEWREWDFDDYNINAHIAMATFGDDLYFISSNYWDGVTTNKAINYVWKFLPGSNVLDYADNVDAIEWAPRLQWESLGAPSSEKIMPEAKLYMRHASDFLASFEVTLNEYRNGDESTKYTQASRTFSASTDREKILEPVPGSFVSNAIELYNNELYECPVLSGIELAYKVVTSPEIKGIKGD